MRIILALCFFCGVSALAAEREFYVDLKGTRVFVHQREAEGGAPTIVLLNGLTYSTREWNTFVAELSALNPSLGILRYDMKGMGKTLLQGSLPVNYPISYQDQVTQLGRLLKKLKLKKVYLAGLSYGGGIGLAFAKEFPEAVNGLFLMAPFTRALENQDTYIRNQIAYTRMAFPFNPASDDELYDFFLRQFIYTNYPQAEPIILENPYKLEAVFRMVQGIRKFEGERVAQDLPPNSVHLMVAGNDQYIPRAVMDNFWSAVPLYVRASRLNIAATEHKIPEAVPAFAAAWITAVLRQPDLSRGKVYEGDAKSFRVHSGSEEIPLPRR